VYQLVGRMHDSATLETVLDEGTAVARAVVRG
jgi:hypothetical protein